ncbi:disease resistance protein RPP13-like [Apium graveolens]|uniref:disease resistance protein RPP13-like n=1 Tax=Apium graveolens TaxID=4045 RepID=UPI003D7BB033
MVDATVSFAIEKLNDFLTQEVNTRTGVKDGVRWLKDELGYLQSSLRNAEANQEMNNLIRLWNDNVRDVANEAVIILERFSVLQEEHAAPKQGFLDHLRSIIWSCKKEANLYDIGKEIELLKRRVVEIKNRRDEYGIPNIIADPDVQRRRRTLLRTTSFENEVDVVGFKDDVKTLLAELVREDPSLGVISIHGMGGLGKTTLASNLYHSSELSHFETRAWVCVSQEYDIKDVLKTMIKSFFGNELDSMKMDEVDLLRHLRKLLQDSDHYLAVIDDVWDIEAWERIKKAFPDKNNGSRIIVTTRNKKVAERVDDRCFVHELRFLREDESWQLFCKRATPSHNLEKLGREMVRKCRGLPLAVVVLSGLLLHKKNYEDWAKVKDHIWRHLKGDSVQIQEILSLSYDDLSSQMRQCFLYFARYPEDHIFRVNKLKLLWIAEGFISEAEEVDGVVMEDVADDYLNELINRNMIQGQSRHAIYNGIGKYLKLLGPSSDDLKLRSLAVINNRNDRVELEEIKLLYTRFIYLKVLDLMSVKSHGIGEEIGDLVLLKFLGLPDNLCPEPIVIPPTIGKLKKLQVLRGSSFSSYEFPREICELKELRHLRFLKFPQKLSRRSLNIGSHPTKLPTLGAIWYEDLIQIDAANLPNLRTLVVTNKSIAGNTYTLDYIGNLTRLHSISLKFRIAVIPIIKPLSYCKRLKWVFLWGKIKDPSDLSFLPDSVTNLTLVSSEFTMDPMPTLGCLSNLTGLDLYKVYVGKKMVCNYDAFPSLQTLRLRYLPNLEEWHVKDGALPSLKAFQLDHCEKLDMVPERVRCVPPIPDIYTH